MSKAKAQNPEYIKKLSMAVQEKLQNPETTIRELEAKYWIANSTISNHTGKALRELNRQESDTVDTLKRTVKKGSELIERYIEKMGNESVQNIDDLAKLASTLKTQQSIVWMIERASDSEKTNLIPVNIQINYK